MEIKKMEEERKSCQTAMAITLIGFVIFLVLYNYFRNGAPTALLFGVASIIFGMKMMYWDLAIRIKQTEAKG